ncbi:hypothetical protein [Mycobacteroides abscessus]|uniref:hypothetical protein n=1 Tax=Mycobacteroides abscessus TaxID=36809 RepID=UPI0012FFED0D|nr:hypothetical protein [Mycobacteroides abscessus]
MTGLELPLTQNTANRSKQLPANAIKPCVSVFTMAATHGNGIADSLDVNLPAAHLD